MSPADSALSEAARLATLRALKILDTPPEERFDRIVRLASRLLHTPMAVLSFVDERRQWFKAAVGLAGVSETPRDWSFCAHAIQHPASPFVVPDASLDSRFADNPLVTGAPGIRFYAGLPIIAEDGAPLGALCVLDREPREFRGEDESALRDLAALASEELQSMSLAGALTMLSAAEQREREEREKFDAFMENTPAVVFIKDSQSRLQYLNSRFEESIGIRRKDVLGKRDDEWLPLEIAAPILENDQRVLTTGRTLTLEEHAPDRDGIERHWMVLKFPMQRGSARPLIGGVAIDITDRVRAEHALRESEEKYRDLVESPHVLIHTFTPEGRITFTNGGWRIALGYDELEIAELSFWDIVAPEFRSNSEQTIRRLESGEILPQHRSIYVAKDGRRIYVEGSAVCTFDPQGKPVAIRAILRDVSRRHAAENELQKALALQRAIFESANAAILSLDTMRIIRTFNRGAEELLGYSAEELVGKQSPHIFHDPGEVKARASAMAKEMGLPEPRNFEEALSLAMTKGPSAQEWTWVRKDGSYVPVRLSISRLLNDVGTDIGWVGIARDITPHRQAEAAIIRAREAAEAANEAKSRFLANMSHEVRTPLNGIIGVNRMLREMGLKPDQQQLADIVQESAEALLTVVNDILDFAKIESGHIEMESLDFDLPELIEKVRQLNAVRASTRRLVIETEIAPNVPQALRGDPTRLRQVLNNLIGNAIKFSENGKIILSVKLARDKERRSGPLVCFTITDCGIGITAEQQAHIFEPFSQADTSTTRVFGGTGLGLSICRQLVQLMGGEIGLESQVDVGSTFWFTAVFALAEEKAAASDLEMPLPPLPKKLRVLLAEDTAVNRLVAVHQLQQLDCDVETVENGRRALEALAEKSYDVVLMDCQMPEMDGYEATAALRQREGPERHTPIVALTANAMAGERERCLALGMDGYLSKPFRPGELYAILAAIARREPPPADPAIASEGVPVFDLPTLSALRREAVDRDNVDHFPSFVEMYRQESEGALKALDHAQQGGDTAEICRAAHKLRGAAANFGASRLQTLCTQLEREAHARRIYEALATIPPLRQEVDRVLKLLQAESRRPLASQTT